MSGVPVPVGHMARRRKVGGVDCRKHTAASVGVNSGEQRVALPSSEVVTK